MSLEEWKMKIRSISDISDSMFYSLKVWAEKSNGNWNILIGTGFLLILLGMFLMLFYTKKFGKEDEYSKGVYYKATSVMLLTIVFCDIVFPKTYMWNQFFMFKYGLAILFYGITLMYQYKKDFS